MLHDHNNTVAVHFTYTWRYGWICFQTVLSNWIVCWTKPRPGKGSPWTNSVGGKMSSWWLSEVGIFLYCQMKIYSWWYWLSCQCAVSFCIMWCCRKYCRGNILFFSWSCTRVHVLLWIDFSPHALADSKWKLFNYHTNRSVSLSVEIKDVIAHCESSKSFVEQCNPVILWQVYFLCWNSTQSHLSSLLYIPITFTWGCDPYLSLSLVQWTPLDGVKHAVWWGILHWLCIAQ